MRTQAILLGIIGIGVAACGQSNDTSGASSVGGARSSSSAAGGSSSSSSVNRGGSSVTSTTSGTVASGGTSANSSSNATQSSQASGGSQGSLSESLAAGGNRNSSASKPLAVGGATNPASTPGTAGRQNGSAGRSNVATEGGSAPGGRANNGGRAAVGANGGVTAVATTKTGGNGGGPANSGGSSSTQGAAGAGSSDATIIPDPSWTCGMPEGIPDPTKGELLFHATVQISGTHDVGVTQFGHRRILDVKGGTLKGDKVNASFESGGLDLELTLSNGSIELEQINILKASDGTMILMRNCGVAAPGDTTVRVVADFEVATSKSLAWLGTGKYVGTRVLDASGSTMQLDVYDVSKLTASEPKIQLKDPTGVPNVSWDCKASTGTKGTTTVFTENVTLGSSVNIGTTKRGSRNIIPITGGTTTGKVEGAILFGGADYQLGGLDARYTLAPKDGEFILVRNCGPSDKLIPVFEARADGKYAFLNANTFFSSGPGAGSGGVSITFYEGK